MTTTNQIVAQSIGTSTNIGEGKFPQKLSAQSDTSAFYVTPEVTNGADAYDSKQIIRIWFTSSSFSYTAAAAVLALKQQARYVDIRPSDKASEIRSRDSLLEVLSGAYIYLWCDIPTVTTAQTLSINITEI